MRLGLLVGYSGSQMSLDLEAIKAADEAGFYAVWSSEAYGSDGITPLAWIGAQTKNIKLGSAIIQMTARVPAMTAMTAMTLDQLSGGRMILGLGASGPQVVEGWHGLAYGKPLARSREYISILRQIINRKAPLEHQGEFYRIPYNGDDATGLGKALKSTIHGRKDMPIYLAALGPKNVALSGEIADGLLPIFCSPEQFDTTIRTQLEEGFAKAGGKDFSSFDVAPMVPVNIGDDTANCRNQIKPMLALYIGGMGAKGKNFYNDLCRRYGYEEAAENIQNLYLEGRRAEAMAEVPDALVDEVALCGPKERVAERLERWRKLPIGTLNINVVGKGASQLDTVRLMAELVL